MNRVTFLATILSLLVIGFGALKISTVSLADEKAHTVTMKGKVFRSDTKKTIPNAVLVLLDEKKTEQQDRTVETKTDDQGNYVFENVTGGQYTVTIRAWYPTQEEAPCQLLMAKTEEKNSSVVVMSEKGQFVQQVFIKGFVVKGNKNLEKDFDFACKSMFGK